MNNRRVGLLACWWFAICLVAPPASAAIPPAEDLAFMQQCRAGIWPAPWLAQLSRTIDVWIMPASDEALAKLRYAPLLPYLHRGDPLFLADVFPTDKPDRAPMYLYLFTRRKDGRYELVTALHVVDGVGINVQK